jgi:hypothetical protein
MFFCTFAAEFKLKKQNETTKNNSITTVAGVVREHSGSRSSKAQFQQRMETLHRRCG